MLNLNHRFELIVKNFYTKTIAIKNPDDIIRALNIFVLRLFMLLSPIDILLSLRSRNFFLKGVFFSAFLFISFAAYSSEAEKAIVVFDDRKWELGWSANKVTNSNDESVFDEYIIKGESINNWSELVTIQFFSGLHKNVTLETFENEVKNSVRTSCPEAEWINYEQKKDERVAYFAIKNCQVQQDQSEIIRLINTDKGIHVFHYAIKKSPMPDSNKQIWMKNLKDIKVK